MTNIDPTVLSFNDLSLSIPIIKALKNVGYESPSPIQAKIIPDKPGQAKTHAAELWTRFSPQSGLVQHLVRADVSIDHFPMKIPVSH